MPEAIDGTGLPEPVIADRRRLVGTLRGRPAAGNGPAKRAETYEEWSARFQAWVDSQPKRDIVIGDSRETIYEGRGE